MPEEGTHATSNAWLPNTMLTILPFALGDTLLRRTDSGRSFEQISLAGLRFPFRVFVFSTRIKLSTLEIESRKCPTSEIRHFYQGDWLPTGRHQQRAHLLRLRIYPLYFFLWKCKLSCDHDVFERNREPKSKPDWKPMKNNSQCHNDHIWSVKRIDRRWEPLLSNHFPASCQLTRIFDWEPSR